MLVPARRRVLTVTILVALPVLIAPAAVAAVGSPTTSSTAPSAASPAAPALAGSQVIVEWKAGTTADQKAAALASLHVDARTPLSETTSAGHPTDVVAVGSPTTTSTALTTLAANPSVASVEPNRLLHRAGKPVPPLASLFNDPLLANGTQWQLLGNDTAPGDTFGVNAVSAFRAGDKGDPNVYVGVVDDGVDISHPDLAANVFTNRWDPVNGRDDDHNGYVDDVHGWDFYNNDNTLYDGHEHFDFVDAHGTVVAGEIAEIQGNHLGGSGVAPRVKIIPAKFLGPETGTTAGAIASLDYLTDMKRRHGLNIVATNNSWEGDDTDSHALQAAIQRGADAGIIFVTIAGNGDWDTGIAYNIDTTPNYPASLRCRLPSGADCMIVTTAFDSYGNMPGFANWGQHTVDLGAPGVSVTSTFPFADYMGYDGTSQAAPLVAGAIALYRSKYPSASPTRARHALLQSVAATPSLAGRTRTGGRLDVAPRCSATRTTCGGAPGGATAASRCSGNSTSPRKTWRLF